MEAMRVLTSPAHTGAVTLAIPQDVQTEAHDYPEELFSKRVWHIQRPLADRELLQRAIEWIRSAKTPLIVTGGGVHYSDATSALARFVEQTGIASTETQAGKGALPFAHPQQLNAIGTCGALGANRLARDADLVIGIGTRYSDFTTASKTQFENSNVRFLNINVAEFDAYKNSALPLVSDARVALEELAAALAGYHVSAEYASRVREYRREWAAEVDRLHQARDGALAVQSAVIGTVNQVSRPQDVVVCAAGSLPGDLLKLWNTRDPKGYHLEYGYSCMGYEIAGGLGVKMADPSREVYVMVGDGSYQMMSSEILTSIQEGYKINIVLLDNHGFGSIGGLSEAVGCQRFGTNYRYRRQTSGQLDGGCLPLDLVANAASYGAHAVKVANVEELERALQEGRNHERTSVVVIETDLFKSVPSYESWWDVAVAEVSEIDTVRAARKQYEAQRAKERIFL
jgi:3D-(3,5/4)-trihydroxycyclohexane-1,2-dione acylhydrolase (decyclizing)